MPRRARLTIAATAIVALVGIPVWASMSSAIAPGAARPILLPADPSAFEPTAVRLLADGTAGSSTTATVDVTATAASTAPTTDAAAAPVSTTPLLPADAAVPAEIGEPLAIEAPSTPGAVVDATRVTPSPPSRPVTAPTAAPATTVAPATTPTTAASSLTPPPATPAPTPLPTVAVGASPTAGRTVLPNPGPLSANQIDRITIAATPTALRDLLTVSVVFLGAGNAVLDRASFSIRFVGQQQRSGSLDVTVPNGTLTLSISWTSVTAPISVDEVNVAVVGVAPPGPGI